MSFAHFTALAQYSYFSSFSFGLVFATFSGGSQTTSLPRTGVSAVARVATNVPTCACLTLTSCADPRIASWLPLKTHNFSKNQLTFLSKKKKSTKTLKFTSNQCKQKATIKSHRNQRTIDRSSILALFHRRRD